MVGIPNNCKASRSARHISTIILIARDSVLQFSTRFCSVILQFAFEVNGFTICRPFAIAAASFDLVFGWRIESLPGTHISVKVVRFFQLPILPNNVLYHSWFIVSLFKLIIEWNLNLYLFHTLYYIWHQCCSYVLYKILIYFCFNLFHVHVLNLVII